MELTPEQRKADQALLAAIQDAMNAYSSAEYALTVTDFVVAVAAQGFNENGDGVTHYRYLVDEVPPAPHRLLGLMEIIRDQYKEDCSGDYPDYE